MVSRYADHLPLYWQSEIYQRVGVDMERSTLAGWVGGTARMLEPLVDVLKRYVFESEKLHGDNIPVPVLAPVNVPSPSRALASTMTPIYNRGTTSIRHCRPIGGVH